MWARDVTVGYKITDDRGTVAEVIDKTVTPMVGAANDIVSLTLRDNTGEWIADLYEYEEVTPDSIT